MDPRPTTTASRAQRRRLLGQLLAATGLLATAPLWITRSVPAMAGGAVADRVPWLGPLGAPDANGIRLPAGFTARVIARSGTRPVPNSLYRWHTFPDGGATFPTPDGGWVYVSNSEVPLTGGAGALRFAPDGTPVDAYPILVATSANCAGGPTPWGSWLSCEEHAAGHVWECDPLGRSAPRLRRALGTFTHEAVAVDPAGRRLYLTEDVSDGRLYRFTPDRWPALDRGTLEVAEVIGGDPFATRPVRWQRVPKPNPLLAPLGADVPTRLQVPTSTAFDGGEGIWWHRGTAYFTTKGDDRLWAYDTRHDRLALLYDESLAANPILDGPDNVTVTPNGDVLVAEDGGDMQLVVITPQGRVSPLLQVTGQDESEIAGPAFSPDGRRLYFSSQRGQGAGGQPLGITYEISGPFSAARPT